MLYQYNQPPNYTIDTNFFNINNYLLDNERFFTKPSLLNVIISFECVVILQHTAQTSVRRKSGYVYLQLAKSISLSVQNSLFLRKK